MEQYLVCKVCKGRLNANKRRPCMLLCCGHTACIQCIEGTMGSEQSFKCHFCKSSNF